MHKTETKNHKVAASGLRRVKPALVIFCCSFYPSNPSQVTPELLFSNLPAILAAHQLFWQQAIYPMLQESRRTGMPFDPMRLEAGCLQVRILENVNTGVYDCQHVNIYDFEQASPRHTSDFLTVSCSKHLQLFSPKLCERFNRLANEHSLQIEVLKFFWNRN